MSTTPFFLIWNPSGEPPTRPHDTLDEALREAKRLAEAHAGQSFIVMRSQCVVHVPVSPIVMVPHAGADGPLNDIWTEVQDQIPF